MPTSQTTEDALAQIEETRSWLGKGGCTVYVSGAHGRLGTIIISQDPQVAAALIAASADLQAGRYTQSTQACLDMVSAARDQALASPRDNLLSILFPIPGPAETESPE